LLAAPRLQAPWKLADVEPREDRILPRAYQTKEVPIYCYVIDDAFDVKYCLALETRARFIHQVMSGDCDVRKGEDLGGHELSCTEMKAIASGGTRL
jgi:hypothetical protein